MPLFLPVLFVLLGLALGSFGNVLLHRLHFREPLLGRSKCPHCKARLRWYDMVPVLSFAILGATCRHCRKPISWQYPLIELGCALAFLLSLHATATPVGAFFTALIFCALLLDAVFDAFHNQVPDVLSALIAVCALLLGWMEGTLLSGFYGAGIALLWFGGQWLVSRGRFVGSGDVLLAAAIGLWLGPMNTVVMILVSYMLGAVVAIWLLVVRKTSLHHTRLAFAPFLAIAAVLAHLGLGSAYLRFLGW